MTDQTDRDESPRERPLRKRYRALAIAAAAAAVAVAGLAYFEASLRRQSSLPPWTRAISDATRGSRPNLLLVVYDTRRRDDFSIGRFGSERGDTPFLDRFGHDAVVFDEAVSPGGWTLPVHASMFSGLGVCDLGIDYYNPGFASFTPELLSLAEVLRLAGYRTAAFADHPVFLSKDENTSLIRGFETWDVIQSFKSFRTVSRRSDDAEVEMSTPLDVLPGARRAVLTATIRDFNAGAWTAPDRGADTDPETGLSLPDLRPLYAVSGYFEARYGGAFEGFVTSDDARPSFLFFNLHMVQDAYPAPALHARWAVELLMLNAGRLGRPLAVPDSANAIDEVIDANFEALGLAYGSFERPSAYVKHVFDTRFLDATFEAVWNRLEEAGLTRNLATVVTSDHGLSFGERGELFYRHEGAWPDEYIVRVPLIVRLPERELGEAWRGVRRERVSLTDVFATFVQLAAGRGVFERDLPVRGASIVDRLKGDHFEPFLLAETAVMPDGYAPWPGIAAYAKAVYQGRWKLVFAPDAVELGRTFWPSDIRLGGDAERPGQVLPDHRPVEGPIARLFDLDADPAGLRDVAEDHPDVVARLRDHIRGSEHCRSALTATGAAEWSDEALETLRALGYVQ